MTWRTGSVRHGAVATSTIDEVAFDGNDWVSTSDEPPFSENRNDSTGAKRLGATPEEWRYCRRVLILLFAVALVIGWIRQYSGWV